MIKGLISKGKNTVKQIGEELKIVCKIIKLTNNISSVYCVLSVMRAIFRAIHPFINIVFPTLIINELFGERQITRLVVYVLATVCLQFIVSFVCNIIERQLSKHEVFVTAGFERLINDKTTQMDFIYLENADIINERERALGAIEQSGGMTEILSTLTGIITSAIQILGVIALMCYHSVLIAMIVIVVKCFTAKFEKIKNEKEFFFWNQNAENNKLLRYINSFTSDYRHGKNIRLFNMKKLLLSKYEQFIVNTKEMFCNISKVRYQNLFASSILMQLQFGIVYCWLGIKILTDSAKFNVGNLYMILNTVNTFDAATSTILSGLVNIHYKVQYMELYLNYLACPNTMEMNDEPLEDRKENFVFQFHDVSFHYPNSDDAMVLKHINCSITSNDKIAIVGENGAGKTTFIKLLLRLYDPTEGYITLNGIDIRKYNYKQYLKMFSVVFQDFNLFSFSISENIRCSSGGEENDIVSEIIHKLNFEQRMHKLTEGVHTVVGRDFDEGGVVFSGGEQQKISIARAMYKNSDYVILDEPTAALDPISEKEIFENLNDIIGNRPAMFISHRMSACYFCNRILVFNRGEIFEDGPHEKLYSAHGKYYELFHAQAQYYK